MTAVNLADAKAHLSELVAESFTVLPVTGGTSGRRRSTSISIRFGYTPAMLCISRQRRSMVPQSTRSTSDLPRPARCSACRRSCWHDKSLLPPHSHSIVPGGFEVMS